MNKKHFQNPGEKFRHFSPPAADFQNINWSDSLVSVGLSDEGSNGVVFIETLQGSIVFKACDDVSTDVFLSKIAQQLDVRSPRLRVVSYDSLQFKQMMRAIQKYCHKYEQLYELIVRRLNRPFYQLLQYIPCLKLNNIGKDRFSAIFQNQERLDQFGRIIGYDIILNNSDRINLYRQIDGNANNLLFKVRSRSFSPLTQDIARDNNNINDIAFEDIMMIDTRPTIMNPNNRQAVKNYELMISTISKFIKNALTFVKQQNPIESEKIGNLLFQKMNTEFYNYTTMKFSTSQLIKITKSILICLYDFYITFPIAMIQELINNLKKKNKQWEDIYWNESLQKIYLSYFEGIRDIFQKFLIPEQQMIRIFKAENKFTKYNHSQQMKETKSQKQQKKEQDQEVSEELLNAFNVDKRSQQDQQRNSQIKGQQQQVLDQDLFQDQSSQKKNSKPVSRQQSQISSKSQINSQLQDSISSHSSNIQKPASNNSIGDSNQNHKTAKQILQQKLQKFRKKNFPK